MAQLVFTKAEKKKAKLRLAIFGPSGSGKTFTALRVATGMGGRIAVIDTENESASKYADRFTFDTLNLEDRTIEGTIAALRAAAAAGYQHVILDSMSHAWQELLDEVDAIANTKFRGNSHAAWSVGTPKQRTLVRAILECPFHLISTMRSKTVWTEEEDKGRKKPVKIGLAPEQGKGIEYEFDMLMEMDVDHRATVSKDRTGKYQDKVIMKPGEELGRELIAWLNEGIATITREDAEVLTTAGRAVGVTPKMIAERAKVAKLGDIRADQLQGLKDWIVNYKDSQQAYDREIETYMQAGVNNGVLGDYVESLPAPYAGDFGKIAELLKQIRLANAPEKWAEILTMTRGELPMAKAV